MFLMNDVAFVVLSFFSNRLTRNVINDFSIDLTETIFAQTFFRRSRIAAVIYTQSQEREANAMKGLNFPTRQPSHLLYITIKHFPQNVENTRRKTMKFLLPLCFSAQHTTWMSRSCMFDYVLTIFFCVISREWKFPLWMHTQCEN